MRASDKFVDWELIGEGGMGSVYKIFDVLLQRVCAIKLSKRSSSEAEVQQSIRESSIWYRFRHLGQVVEVYEIRKYKSGKIAILMEYIENGNIRKDIDNRTLNKRDKLLVLFDVLSALKNCADLYPGFCHLDIKPENCLRTAYGLTKLTDFGLACSSRSDLSRESSLKQETDPFSSLFFLSEQGGACVGTPPYMAPEQILGLRTVGSKSDVYAVGVMALELFLGEHPLARAGNMESIFAAHLSGSLQKCAQEVLPEFLGAHAVPLVKSLDTDPSQRLSVSELRSSVGEALDGPALLKQQNLRRIPDPSEETTRVTRSFLAIGREADAEADLRLNLSLDPYNAEGWFLLSKTIWESDVLPRVSNANSPSDRKLTSFLLEACRYGIRAQILNPQYCSSNTDAGLLVSTVIPQMCYQMKMNAAGLGKKYSKWLTKLKHEELAWLQHEDRRLTQQEYRDMCLCVRCGEAKFYQVQRCPRCGFLPTEVRDLFLTNVLHVTRVKHMKGNEKASYASAMKQLRCVGHGVDEAIAGITSDPQFSRKLQEFARGDGAKMLELVHRGPSKKDVKDLRAFIRHTRYEGVLRNIRGLVDRWFGKYR